MRLYFFLLLSFILSCRDPNIEKQTTLANDTLKQGQKNRKRQKVELIWKTDHVKIWGDTSDSKLTIDYASYRFEPYNSFQNFRVTQIFKGHKFSINYGSNPNAKRFKTRITDTYKSEGLNFAGHYCFVAWDCGSDCQSSAVVDLSDGMVYDGPEASLGYNFKRDSKLLIVNPPDSTGFYDDCIYCHPEIWIWDENKKIFEQRNPL